MSLSSRSVAGSVERIAEADVCIPASWKPIVQPHAKCYSQRGRVLAVHAWTQLQLTHLLARHTCRRLLSLSWLIHFQWNNSLLFNEEANKEGTLKGSLASAGSVRLCKTAPEVNGRKKKFLKDCWMKTSLGHGFFFSQSPSLHAFVSFVFAREAERDWKWDLNFSPCMDVRKDNSIHLYIW